MDSAYFDKEPEIKRLQFLWAASSTYAEKNPQLSRHFVSNLEILKKQSHLENIVADIQHEYCPHCHSILRPNNHEVKLKAKPQLGYRIRRLQKRVERGVFLSNKERKMLRQWENASNKLAVSCSICNKRSLFQGGKRTQSMVSKNRCSFSNERRSTGSYKGSPMTPASHNRSHGFNTTPGSNRSWTNSPHTPAHSTPYSTPSSARIKTPSTTTPLTGSSSRNSKKMRKGKHQQLQSMLASAKKEKGESSKSPLSAFLQSL